mmetsp:Transcript_14041/g.20423  ORF Transcript_14041/g.20423 Transcript_14041/m.20423 type:complete len:349 (-) Transcript_14041:121-1167(-)
MSFLVYLNMPLLGLLKSLAPLIVVNILIGTDGLEHILNSRHHSLKTTEVDVGSVVKLLEYLISILSYLILDVHLSTVLVLLFTGKGVVDAKVLWESGLGLLELVIVKKGIGVSNSKEEPCLSLVGSSSWGLLVKEATDESTVRGNSGSGGNHDVIGFRILLGQKHNLSGGSGHLYLISGGSITQEVGADSLLGGIVSLELWAPVIGTTDAKRSGLSSHIISVTRRSDGVKTDIVGLSVLLTVTRGHYSPGLSLPVREVTVVIDDDVASLSGGLGSNNTLGGNNLSGERGLVLVNIYRNSGLIKVRLCLEEILGGDLGAESWLCLGGKGGSRGNYGGESESGLHSIIDY